MVEALIQKVIQTSDEDEISVNSVFLQYTSLMIKGKTFNMSSGKVPLYIASTSRVEGRAFW